MSNKDTNAKLYCQVGINRWDRFKLMVCGLLRPSKAVANSRWWRYFSKFIPMIWVRPKRLGGLSVLFHPVDDSHCLIFEEVLLDSGYNTEKLSFSPDTVFDCGAHIGLFSLSIASKYPQAKIFAYEPNPSNASLIRRQIAKNQLNVEVFECAVSTENSEVFFEILNSHHGVLRKERQFGTGLRVETVDLSTVVAGIGAESLLVKLDVEGEERAILPSLIPVLPQQCALFFETHDGASGWNFAESILSSNGFMVELVRENGKFYDGFAQRVH